MYTRGIHNSCCHDNNAKNERTSEHTKDAVGHMGADVIDIRNPVVIVASGTACLHEQIVPVKGLCLNCIY